MFSTFHGLIQKDALNYEKIFYYHTKKYCNVISNHARIMISNFIPQMDFINVNTDFICLIKIQLVHKLVLILSLNHIKEL